MLKEFIKNVDISNMPIGPQADLVERLAGLNNSLPYEYREEKHLNITKKFCWKPGTYDNVKNIRSSFLGTDGKYKSIMDIFDKPERNSRTYWLIRFRRDLNEIDKILIQKRSSGSIWMDDDSTIKQMKTDAITEIIKLFNDYKNYVTMINKLHNCDDKVEYIMYDRSANNLNWPKFIDNQLNDSYQFKTHASKIILRKSTNDIYIIHPFKDITMNVYVGEETSPMYQYNIGHALMMYKINIKWLFSLAFGLGNRARHSNYSPGRTRFWYKPLIQGNKHPYMNYHNYNNDSLVDNRVEPESWKIQMSSDANPCFGNISYLYGNDTNINFIKMIETVYTWLSTYRDGVTHPLNDVYSGYYGHPSFHDPNVTEDYYNRIGTHTNSCYNRLSDYVLDVSKRQDICMTQCINDIRKDCSGFKFDVRTVRENIITSWTKKETRRLMNTLEFIEIDSDKNLIPDFNPEDDNYPITTTTVSTIPNASLENAMLEWVRDQNS